MSFRRLHVVTTTILASACPALTSLSAQTTVYPEKVFYNAAKTDASTRASNGVDTIYFMQPELFHKGHGKITGYRVLLQDQDYNTAETVQFGTVRYAQNGLPDVTAAGLVNNAGGSLRFPMPASGVVSAALWTITLNTAFDAPSDIGLRLIFPAAASNADGVGVHTQRDTTSMLTASFRKQWTFYLNANAAANYYGPGTSMHFGAMYEEPITQMFASSTLYQATAEDLFGPESLHPDPVRGDKVGWKFNATKFPSGVAVLLLDGTLRNPPITTNLGPLFLQAPVGVIQLPFVLDVNGQASTPPLLPPAKLTLWTQSIFVDLVSGVARASDVAGVVAQ